MTLTTAQKASLKTAIQGSSDTNQLFIDGNTSGLADLLNAAFAPDFWVWRTFIADSEMYESPSESAGVWSWTIYIARSQGERDAWRQMVNMKGGVNPSLANVRTAIADIFSGAGGLAQRTFLLEIGRRRCTRVEKVFAVGTGSTAVPATLVLEGPIAAVDLQNLWCYVSLLLLFLGRGTPGPPTNNPASVHTASFASSGPHADGETSRGPSVSGFTSRGPRATDLESI